MLNKLKQYKIDLIVLVLLLVIAGVAHGYNMFQFPYYENDEGIYISQAWSIVTQGKFSPYTYYFDHAPAGWILIALWTKLSGGFFTFGTSVNSGRVLMLLLHLGTSVLLFYVTKKLSKSLIASIIAVLIFSLSPLGIYFQRRVLLDNIMTFWVFLSLAILLKDRLRLSHIIISAITFGIAVTTKENAVFLIPAFIYTLFVRAHIHHRSFAIIKWFSVMGLIVFIYILYALLRGEFFPVGFFGDNKEHVSLITSLYEYTTRGAHLPFWDKGSDFYNNLIDWINKDKYLIIFGGATTILTSILSIRIKIFRIPVVFTLLLWGFLMRGFLINHYIIPLIPFLGLSMGILLDFLAKKVSLGKKYLYLPLVILLIFGTIILPLTLPSPHYIKDETSSQIKAINWIKQNLPSESFIVIDHYAFVDLRDKRYAGDKEFKNADYFWKLDFDPEIKNVKYDNNWRKIEYIALSHEMLKQMKLRNQQFVKSAFINSYPIVEWSENSTAFIDLEKFISTNGDWISIYKVKGSDEIALENSWKFYKSSFIKSYGQVVDPNNNFSTTSESQSYAMLRAVWLNDKETFDGVWVWTKDHFQHRTQDELFSWLWVKDGEDYKLGDSASASDADQDIALALLFAYKKWGEENYLTEAKEIIRDIWEKEVVRINGRYYLISSTGAEREDGYLANPSYLSPASYRIFAEVDPENDWSLLARDSYYLLNRLGELNNNDIYLPPNWILLDKQTGVIKSPARHIENTDVSDYGFDAFRTMWRIALDAKWFNNTDAISYLNKVEPFFESELNDKNKISAVYDLNGNEKVEYATISTNTGALSTFTITNPKLAKKFYEDRFDAEFDFENGFWADKNNYFDQNWAWFGTALYTNSLPNLWRKN